MQQPATSTSASNTIGHGYFQVAEQPTARRQLRRLTEGLALQHLEFIDKAKDDGWPMDKVRDALVAQFGYRPLTRGSFSGIISRARRLREPQQTAASASTVPAQPPAQEAPMPLRVINTPMAAAPQVVAIRPSSQSISEIRAAQEAYQAQVIALLSGFNSKLDALTIKVDQMLEQAALAPAPELPAQQPAIARRIVRPEDLVPYLPILSNAKMMGATRDKIQAYLVKEFGRSNLSEIAPSSLSAMISTARRLAKLLPAQAHVAQTSFIGMH